MSIERKITGGLVDTPDDWRDFSIDRMFGSLPLSELPKEFFQMYFPFFVKDQSDSDLCTAFACSYAKEAQENILISPEYQFAKTKQIMGDHKPWGADLRSAMKVLVKYGAIETSQSKYYLNGNRDQIANWENWGERFDIYAIKHLSKSFFKVDGPHDTFDNFRQALWKFREKRQVIVTGCKWRNEWTNIGRGIIPKEIPEFASFGHSFVFVGQKIINEEVYLIALLSNTEYMGDHGYFYFPREVVNQEFKWGGYMVVDMDQELVSFLFERGWNVNMKYFAKMIIFIKNYINDILK